MKAQGLQVLLIGDSPGESDEGMKNIIRALAATLRQSFGVSVNIETPIGAIRNRRSYINASVLHYTAGPTYRSILLMAWLGRQLQGARQIISLTHPQLGYFSNILFGLFPPDCVIAMSKWWQARGSQLGIPTKLLSLSGVDLKKFRPASAEEKQQLRQQLGLPLDRMIVLHVGHLKSDRNLEPLIYLQSPPDVQVVVLGSTSTKSSEALIARLRAAGCIVRRDFVPAIEEFYQAADCYVFPTLDAKAAVQIPLSVLEAMATNLPIVTTPFGGLPDFFTPGHGLWYTNEEQLVGLPLIVQRAVETEPVQTRDKVQQFSWENIAHQLLAVYVDLLG